MHTPDCGRKPSSIVGGSEATPYSIPWQVGLVIPGRDCSICPPRTKPSCGGTLISDRHVLTAAHCINRKLPEVLVGEHKTTSAEDGTRHRICRAVNHPNWGKAGNNHDFSILHLEKPVQFGSRVAPACLAKPSMGGDFLAGKRMTISGWGTQSFGGYAPTVLHTASVTGNTHAQCKRIYGRRGIWVTITSAMLCAWKPEGGIDTCQGDSGGKQLYYSNSCELNILS